MGRGTWRATVHGVAKSQTGLSNTIKSCCWWTLRFDWTSCILSTLWEKNVAYKGLFLYFYGGNAREYIWERERIQERFSRKDTNWVELPKMWAKMWRNEFPQRRLRGKDRGGSEQAGIWFRQCEKCEKPSWMVEEGWVTPHESKSHSSEHSRPLHLGQRLCRYRMGPGPKFQPYLDEQGWALVSLCKEWRRNTSSILRGSWIAQPFAFFSNTGVKTAFLVRKKWTLIMTYQNKNDVGNTNNTNNFNGICNVSFFQFFIKTFICNNII